LQGQQAGEERGVVAVTKLTFITLATAAGLGVEAVTARGTSRVGAGAVYCDATELQEIVGYTAVTSSNVSGEFEGADFDKPVRLDNGMIFEFTEYSYTYSYRPDVIVFARSVTYQGRAMTLYKLLIEDELYDAIRVR
jgi:hypothetical protein